MDSDIPLAWRYEANRKAAETLFDNQVDGPITMPAVGVTVDFHGTDGWQSLRTESGRFSFFKAVDRQRFHTAMVVVAPVFPRCDSSKDSNDLLNCVKPDFEKQKDGKDIDFEYEASHELAPVCVAFSRKRPERDTRNAPGVDLMLEVHGYICKHPTRVNVFVNVNYSERYRPEVSSVPTRAKEMLNKVSFSP